MADNFGLLLFLFLIPMCYSNYGYQENRTDEEEVTPRKSFNPVPIPNHSMNFISVDDGQMDSNLSGTVFQTSKMYFCQTSPPPTDEYGIMYGSKSWIFPKQDINLTITYPNEEESDCVDCNRDYIITRMKVVLQTNGIRTAAYFNNGGLLTDFLSLSFIVEAATTISYNLSINGVHKSSVNVHLLFEQDSRWSC